MKRTLALLLCIVLAITCFCACSSGNNGKPNVAPQESRSVHFSSLDEFKDYLSNEDEAAMFSDRSSTIYVPDEAQVTEAFDAELNEIVIDNDNYYFRYTINGVNMNEISSTHNIVDAISESNATTYAPESEKPIDEETARVCSEDLMIGWQRNSNGEEALNMLAASNPIDYWTDHPGYYYTTAPYIGMDNPLSYMIYWVQDGYFFQASVPAGQLDIFWENCDTMITNLE